MTPHEVRARCAELGTPIVQSTLANYKAGGLIFPPVVQSLGRKVGKVSTYRDEVPYEIYTAQRLSGRDFGFSLDAVALFRLQWLAGGQEFPGGQPLDLYVGGGSLLWGLVFNLAKIGMPLDGQFVFFLYPPQQMAEIIDFVRRQEPDSLTENLPTDTRSETGEELRGLVLLRRKGDGHYILALLYDTKARVLTIMGVLPEALQ
jgi:hypothetical protein